MISVFIADANLKERLALRLLCLVLDMNIVGDAEDWQTTLLDAPKTIPNLLLVDWELLPNPPAKAIAELRAACPFPLVIVLISNWSLRKQAALSASADIFISKQDPADHVLETLRLAASTLHIQADRFYANAPVLMMGHIGR